MRSVRLQELTKRSLLGLMLLFSPASAFSQEPTSEPANVVAREAEGACELNNLYIDLLVLEAKKSKERVFVIARLGKGERARLNWQRLEKAHFFLTNGKELPESQIVTAVGNNAASGSGRLEFYLGSKLLLVSEAKKGRNVCLNCCDSPN